MSKILTPSSVAMRPDASYFSPERLAMLNRIFDAVCTEEGVISEQQRDELAANLLEAGKFTWDEETLIKVMKFDFAGFRN